MYGWIWRRLPGGRVAKLTGSLLLAAAVVLALFLVVFPWLGPKLAFNHVTVNPPTPTSTGHAAPSS